MKQQIFGIILILSLFGCGGEAAHTLSLRIQFPESLKKGGARYRRFLSRAERLNVSLKVGDRTYENAFPVQQWESLALPVDTVSLDSSEKICVHIRVWDRSGDQTPRNYPVLEGRKVFKVGELTDGVMLVKLSLKIAPESLD